jgi:hypothetical protein
MAEDLCSIVERRGGGWSSWIRSGGGGVERCGGVGGGWGRGEGGFLLLWIVVVVWILLSSVLVTAIKEDVGSFLWGK